MAGAGLATGNPQLLTMGVGGLLGGGGNNLFSTFFGGQNPIIPFNPYGKGTVSGGGATLQTPQIGNPNMFLPGSTPGDPSQFLSLLQGLGGLS